MVGRSLDIMHIKIKNLNAVSNQPKLKHLDGGILL
jgi:hypothetical protein